MVPNVRTCEAAARWTRPGSRRPTRVTTSRSWSTVRRAGAGGSSTADSLGSLIVRNLTPGSDYQWDDETTGQTTPPFRCSHPATNPAVDSPLYTDQPMHQGLELHHHAGRHHAGRHRPLPLRRDLCGVEPCPTVIEYSGYNGPDRPTPSQRSSPRLSAYQVHGLR